MYRECEGGVQLRIVSIDFETTGLLPEDEIIGYGYYYGKKFIEGYVYSAVTIHPQALRTHGISREKLEMFRTNGNAITQKQFVEKTTAFMEEVSERGKYPLVLCAYNGYKLDYPKLFGTIMKYSINPTNAINRMYLYSLCDPYLIVKNMWKTTASIAQARVYYRLFRESYEEHDAGADAKALQRVIQHKSFDDVDVTKFSSVYNKRAKDYIMSFLMKAKEKRVKTCKAIDRALKKKNSQKREPLSLRRPPQPKKSSREQAFELPDDV